MKTKAIKGHPSERRMSKHLKQHPSTHKYEKKTYDTKELSQLSDEHNKGLKDKVEL